MQLYSSIILSSLLLMGVANYTSSNKIAAPEAEEVQISLTAQTSSEVNSTLPPHRGSGR